MWKHIREAAQYGAKRTAQVTNAIGLIETFNAAASEALEMDAVDRDTIIALVARTNAARSAVKNLKPRPPQTGRRSSGKVKKTQRALEEKFDEILENMQELKWTSFELR